MKKEIMAGKMQKGGKCTVCARPHHKSVHAFQNGKRSLNPVQKSKDNMVMEGKNEVENN